MNLVELYDTLLVPNGDEKVFNAIPIPEYPNFRVAVDIESNPILLLSVANVSKNIALKNFRLKYLQLQQNVECKISDNGKSTFQTFTVITFTSTDRNLQEYFLKISETLIKALSTKPTQQQVIEALNKFVEVFRALTDTPTNTVQGLWSELFIIEASKEPTTLLNYWHCIPEEKFDFNADIEKLEVKSSSRLERIHIFASEQLNPPPDKQVIIASVFLKQNIHGQSIKDIANSIQQKINDIELAEKMFAIISKTLGNTLEQSIRIKFDYHLAKNSLQFYRHQDIHSIEELHIPNEVSEVHYKSDLTSLKSIKPSELNIGGQLFTSI